jgi:hypothetical protein
MNNINNINNIDDIDNIFNYVIKLIINDKYREYYDFMNSDMVSVIMIFIFYHILLESIGNKNINNEINIKHINNFNIKNNNNNIKIKSDDFINDISLYYNIINNLSISPDNNIKNKIYNILDKNINQTINYYSKIINSLINDTDMKDYKNGIYHNLKNTVICNIKLEGVIPGIIMDDKYKYLLLHNYFLIRLINNKLYDHKSIINYNN